MHFITRNIRWIGLSFSAALLMAACGSSEGTDTIDEENDASASTEEVGEAEDGGGDDNSGDDSSGEGSGGEGSGASADIDAEARAAVVANAQWSDNVTITVDGDSFIFESDGLPSHEFLETYLADGPDGKYVAGGVEAYDAQFEIPLVPELADTPSETGNGAIGVAISGAVFFDPYEGDGSDTIANDDNETIDGVPFIDACGGHPLPNSISYHYHGIPFCITDSVDTDGEHSALIGYLFDGNPIYGPQDVDGEEPTDLDECLGHTGPTPEFEEDVYHYHIVSTANYISECLVGVASNTGDTGGPGGGGPGGGGPGGGGPRE